MGVVRGAPHWSPKCAMSMVNDGKNLLFMELALCLEACFLVKREKGKTQTVENTVVNIIVCCSLKIICKWNKIIKG